MKKLLSIVCAATCLTLSAGQAVAQAQAYPTKPIKIIVPATPGGTGDIFARAIAIKLQESLGQPVIVENKPGAGGSLPAQALQSAAADGDLAQVETFARGTRALTLRDNDLSHNWKPRLFSLVGHESPSNPIFVPLPGYSAAGPANCVCSSRYTPSRASKSACVPCSSSVA